MKGLFLCMATAVAIATSTLVAAEELAYISPSTEDLEIRIIGSDGVGERQLFEISNSVAPIDRIGDRLSWRPDGDELAFDSGHDAFSSLYVRDLYSITGDGEKLRRLTNPPTTDDYSSFAQGRVIVDIDSSIGGREYSVFVDGASSPVRFTAAAGSRPRVTFDSVADFGPNVRQFVRVFLFNPGPGQKSCFFDIGVFADVIPGETVFAGAMPLLVNDSHCPFAFNPSWQVDGNDIMFMKQPQSQELSVNFDIFRTSARPAPGSTAADERLVLADPSLFDDWYRVLMSPGTSPEQRDDMLFLINTSDDLLALAPDYTNAGSNFELPTPCPVFTCQILDVEWLPDGTNVLLANYEEELFGNSIAGVIYERVGTDWQPLLRLPGEVIGSLSISQDGRTIAFTRASQVFDQFNRQKGPRERCPCDIWLVDRDGSNLRLLKRDARTPAFRPAAASAASTQILSSVLPSSRSVEVGGTASFFATIANVGTETATGCSMGAGSAGPGDFTYQQTDPTTNKPIGNVNQPVDIEPGGTRTMVFAVTPSSAFLPREVAASFNCENTVPAPVISGLNTVILSASDTPTPDVIALSATISGDGIVSALPSGVASGAFSVASINVGSSGTLVVSADTGDANLGVSLTLCQTDPISGSCINATSPTQDPLAVEMSAGATPTFAVFVTAESDVPLDPANNRVFVRFRQTNGDTRGATSVAVSTI